MKCQNWCRKLKVENLWSSTSTSIFKGKANYCRISQKTVKIKLFGFSQALTVKTDTELLNFETALQKTAAKKNPCFAECKFRKTLGILQWIGFHLNNPWGKIHRTKADKRPNHLQIWAMAAILSLHNKHVLGWKHAGVSQAGFNVRP